MLQFAEAHIREHSEGIPIVALAAVLCGGVAKEGRPSGAENPSTESLGPALLYAVLNLSVIRTLPVFCTGSLLPGKNEANVAGHAPRIFEHLRPQAKTEWP
jgi:hypothetical protein